MARRRVYKTSSARETMALAKDLARHLKPGSVLALTGELGSGKTTFIKGIALGLGLSDADEVKSPGFVLMHIYPTKIPLYHFDLYRLDSSKEVQSIGMEEFLDDPNTISCIEWAEKARHLLPSSALPIHFAIEGENIRSIRFGLPARRRTKG